MSEGQSRGYWSEANWQHSTALLLARRPVHTTQPWLENLAHDIGVCHEICSGELGEKSRKESRAAVVGAPFTFTIAVRRASNIFTALESILHLGGISTVNAVAVLLQPGE